MSENQKPEPMPDIPLDVTDAAAPVPPSQRPSSTVPADVTTDFDESDSAPSSQRLGLSGNASRTPVTNQSVADYRLLNKLGEGGMGRVFKAVDAQGRAVAIKLLSPHLTCSDEALQRFKQEGIIASQINHPHCVFVHRVDEDRGTPYIAMELMTGKTLKDLVQTQGPLPYKEAVRLIVQCVDGLIEAHRLGMIHRDIKPANCYLDEEGNVKIGDFGLARSLVDDSELTRTGAFLGTPLFASPEHLLGQKIDERSDIYSLSATLYYLLAGQAPFESPNAAQVIAKIASSDPPSFKESGVSVPGALEAIVMHGLARDRNKRFESFQKMRAELLPMIAPEREVASLARRAVAGFLDMSIFSVLFRLTILPLSGLLGAQFTDLPRWLPYLAVVGWFLYLWLFEWLCGWTIGKRIVKLKVVDCQLGMRPSASKLLLRAGVFVAAMQFIRVTYHTFLFQFDEIWASLASVSGFAFGMAVIMLTWKRSGRRQLTHEWISQTETCLAVAQRTTVSAQLQLPEWSLPMQAHQDYPAQLGRFAIKGQLLTSHAGQWFLAHDVKLDREVWIHWLPVGAPPVSADRKDCLLRTRMRVIESGIEQNRHWDAFLAPDGVPLSVFIEHGVHLPWPIAQHLISQLVTECGEADGQNSTNDFWNVNRYWLDSAGRLTFAEADLALESTCTSNSPEDILQQVALAALPPKHGLRHSMRSVASVRQPICSVADLPSYGGLRLLECLAKRRATLAQIKSDLAQVNQSADQVLPSMRFVHAATVTLLVGPFMITAMVILMVNMIVTVDMRVRNARQLAAVSHILKFPEKYPSAFQGLTQAAREQWSKREKIEQLQQLLKLNQSELQTVFAHSNPIERAALTAMGVSQAFVDSDMLPDEISRPEENNAAEPSATDGDNDVVEIKVPVDIRVSGLTSKTIAGKDLLSHAAADQDLWQPVRMSEGQRSTCWAFLSYPLVFLTLWTGLTRGGLAQMLTGVAVVRRDGCRIGRLRAWLRSLLLFGPFTLLAWLVIWLEADGVQWLWLTMQLKIALGLLPAFYLVGALIWPQIGPHDRLCQTAVVPR